MSATSSWPGTTDPTTDSWQFESQWRARPGDGPARCAQRLQACLEGLAVLHPSLRQWYDADQPVALDRDSLTDLVNQEWDEDDPDEGATIFLWNGRKDDDTTAELSLDCGSTVDYLTNGVSILLPRPAGAPELFGAETMISLFRTVISAWQPQWCRVQSRGLRESTGRDSIDVLGSWMVYLDHELYVRDGDLPDGVRTVDCPGDGELFVVAPSLAEIRLEAIDQLRRTVTFPEDWSTLR